MKKHSHFLLWLAGALVLIAVLAGGISIALGVPNGFKVSRLLCDIMSNDDLDANVAVNISSNGLEADWEMFRRSNGDVSLVGLTSSGVTIYFSENHLIFDNGRSYDLEDTIPFDSSKLSGLMKALPLAGIKRESLDDTTVYRLEPSGKKLAYLTSKFDGIDAFKAEFTEQNNRLIHIDMEIQYKNTPYKASIKLLSPQTRQIPKEVWAPDPSKIQSIRVLKPLGNALMQFFTETPIAAQIAIGADCGPINISNTMTLYGTERGMYLERNGSINQLGKTAFSNQAMLGLGYQFCRNGRFTQVDTSGSYSLVIPSELVKSFCTKMVPEIENFPITYEDGALVLEVKENMLHSIQLDCSGQMPFLITTVPISLGVKVTPMERSSIILPEGIQ